MYWLNNLLTLATATTEEIDAQDPQVQLVWFVLCFLFLIVVIVAAVVVSAAATSASASGAISDDDDNPPNS